MPKRTETWYIRYSLKSGTRIIHVKEPFPCTAGYHGRLHKFWRKHRFSSRNQNPIYKVITDMNNVQLLHEGGWNLPRTPVKNLEKALLLDEPEHPISLVAPNGRVYIREYQ